MHACHQCEVIYHVHMITRRRTWQAWYAPNWVMWDPSWHGHVMDVPAGWFQ